MRGRNSAPMAKQSWNPMPTMGHTPGARTKRPHPLRDGWQVDKLWHNHPPRGVSRVVYLGNPAPATRRLLCHALQGDEPNKQDLVSGI